MSNDHSRYCPSSAEQWFNCIGGLVNNIGKKSEETEYNKSGTVAHDLAALCLKDNLDAKDIKSMKPGQIKLVDKDMRRRVQSYIDDIRAMRKIHDVKMEGIEHTVDLSNVLNLEGEQGTCDYFMYTGKVLQLRDYKDGALPVSAKKNKQMYLYLAGIIEEIEMSEEFNPSTKIEFFIHQPRLNKVDYWEVEYAEFFRFKLAAKKKVALGESIINFEEELTDDHFCPSEKTCQWCLEKPTCKYLAKHSLSLISDSFENLDDLPDAKNEVKEVIKNLKEIDLERLAYILDNATLFRSWLKSIENYALNISIDGVEIPGYKAVLGNAGSRKWTDIEEATKLLKAFRIKMDDMYKQSLQSPTQILSYAEDNFKKNKIKKIEQINELVTRGEAKPTLVKESDKRERYTENCLDLLDSEEDNFDDLC